VKLNVSHLILICDVNNVLDVLMLYKIAVDKFRVLVFEFMRIVVVIKTRYKVYCCEKR